MGNLSNLFISQSFKSLIHLETDNSASSALTELQDGVGTPLGLFVNTDGDFQAVGEISSSLLAGVGNVTLYSASVDFRLDALETDTGSQDARLDALEAFTSSQEAINTELFAFTASINSFTSSQIILNSGFSTTASFNTYTSSTDGRLDNIEITSASLNTSVSNINSFTSSTNISISNLNSTSASLLSSVTQLNSYTASVSPLITGSFLVTASVNFTTFTFTKGDSSTFDLYADTGSLTPLSEFNSYTASQAAIIATTGSNTFVGNNTFSGSVNGLVNTLNVTSLTASMDCSLGNFFTLQLQTGSIIRLESDNIQSGQTIALSVTQPSDGTGSLTFDNTFKFPNNFSYIASNVTSSLDVLTFVTFNTSSLLGTFVNRMV